MLRRRLDEVGSSVSWILFTGLLTLQHIRLFALRAYMCLMARGERLRELTLPVGGVGSNSIHCLVLRPL